MQFEENGDDFITIDGLEWTPECGVSWTANKTPHFSYSQADIISNIDKYCRELTEGSLEELGTKLISSSLDTEFFRGWVIWPEENNFSFLKVLLQTQSLQKYALSCIQQLLISTSYTTPTESDLKFIERVLQEMRFLPVFYNEDDLNTVLTETLESAHDSVKILLLRMLSLIVHKADAILKVLLDLMRSSPNLTSDIIMCLANLELTGERSSEVRDMIKDEILATASPTDLNLVVHFLIQTTNGENAQSTVDAFRMNVIINSNDGEEDDARIFMLDQMTYKLTINSDFEKCFVNTIKKTSELKVLDVWVLFCLYATSSKRQEVQQVFEKLSATTLTTEIIEESIRGYKKTLSGLQRAITDLASWCLEHTNGRVVDLGAAITKAMFETVESMSVQQDLIGSLLLLVGIGAEMNQLRATELLLEIAHTDLPRLSKHVHIIEGLLTNLHSLPLDVLKICSEVIVLVNFVDESSLNAGRQLEVFINKAVGFGKREWKTVGISLGAALIIRFMTLQASGQAASEVFDRIYQLIEMDKESVAIFYELINESDSLTKPMAIHIIDRINELIATLTINNDGGPDFRYGTEDTETAIDIKMGLTVPINTRANSTLLNARTTKGSALFVLIKSALMLYLKANQLLEQKAPITKLPLRLFDTERSEVSRCEMASICFAAHNWIYDILKFEATEENESKWDRLDHILELDSTLLKCLSNEQSFTDPLFGAVFGKYSLQLKKLPEDENRQFAFYRAFRSVFALPTFDVCIMITELEVPLSIQQQRRLKFLLEDYAYLITPSKKGVSLLHTPPPSIIRLLVHSILPSIIKDDDSLARRILEILTVQLQMGIYKQKEMFSELLVQISDHESRNEAFNALAQLEDQCSIGLKMALMIALKSILHSGPPTKIRRECHENEVICKMCDEILKMNETSLNNKQLKELLSEMFGHMAKPLSTIHRFAKTVLLKEILQGNETSSEYPSLTSNTYHIFFEACFVSLVKELQDFNESFKKQKMGMITRDAIEQILGQLKKISKLSVYLLMTSVNDVVPKPLLKAVITVGGKWMEQFIDTLPILQEGFEVNKELVSGIVNHVKLVRKNINSKIEHALKNEPKLHRTCNKTMLKLMEWPFELKTALGQLDPEDSSSIHIMPALTLTGEVIKQVELFSQNPAG